MAVSIELVLKPMKELQNPGYLLDGAINVPRFVEATAGKTSEMFAERLAGIRVGFATLESFKWKGTNGHLWRQSTGSRYNQRRR